MDLVSCDCETTCGYRYGICCEHHEVSEYEESILII